MELLGMCRNQSEVSTILNNAEEDSDDEELEEQTFEEGIPNLARLRLAVNYNQKQVQNLLMSVTEKSDQSDTEYIICQNTKEIFLVETIFWWTVPITCYADPNF